MNTALTQDNLPLPGASPVEQTGEWHMGIPQGSITIPQHIIIPPSPGAVGPDKRPQPQTYQINSEIRISYDQQGKTRGPETAPLNHLATTQPLLRNGQSTSPNTVGRQRAQVNSFLHR